MKRVLGFLKKLSANNNREWFNTHKSEYLEIKKTTDALALSLIAEVARLNPEAARLSVADCTYRIYRDTRFSHEKTPYKTHIGIFINPPKGKKGLTLGYYLHIEPGNSFICGGTIGLPSPVLKAIRKSIYDNVDEYRSIVENPDFKKAFSQVGDSFLKTYPRGFPKDWEYMDYLRPKNYVVAKNLSDKEMCEDNLVEKLVPYLELIKPFNDFINYTVEDFDE